jgi:hypothetical protein
MPNEPHSIARYFSEAARREAAFAHYEDTTAGPRAWSEWDQAWVFDALGLMAAHDGLDKVAVPDSHHLAHVLLERYGTGDTGHLMPSVSALMLELDHFARRFDRGWYSRTLPCVLGFQPAFDTYDPAVDGPNLSAQPARWHNLVQDVHQHAQRRQRHADVQRAVAAGVREAAPLARRSVVRVENRVSQPRPTVAVRAVALPAREVV